MNWWVCDKGGVLLKGVTGETRIGEGWSPSCESHDRATVRTFHTRTASPCRVSNRLISQSDCPRRDDTLDCEELAAQRRREGNFNFAGTAYRVSGTPYTPEREQQRARTRLRKKNITVQGSYSSYMALKSGTSVMSTKYTTAKFFILSATDASVSSICMQVSSASDPKRMMTTRDSS